MQMTRRYDDCEVDYSAKCLELRKLLAGHSLEADLKLSLYMVASETPKSLKPRPAICMDPGLVNQEIPSVRLLDIYLRTSSLSPSAVNLLHSILLHDSEQRLKHIPSDSFLEIFKRVQHAINYRQPSHVFKIMATKHANIECKWQAIRGNKRSIFAFYNAKIRTMHSLLNLGIHPQVLEDGGLYLWTDLKHCLESLEDAWCWGKSDIGTKMKIVLVLEVVEAEDAHRKVPKAITESGEVASEERSYLLLRPDLARIRYVLVFADYAPEPVEQVINLKQPKPLRLKKTLVVLGTAVAVGVIYSLLYSKNRFCRPTHAPTPPTILSA